MKRSILLCALLLGLAGVVGATPFVFDFGGPFGVQGLEPGVDVMVNGGEVIPGDTTVSITGTTFSFSGSGMWVNPNDASDFVMFSFSGVSDSDPFINWAWSQTSGSKQASISITFTQPSVGTYQSALAGFNGSLGVVQKGDLAATNIQAHNYVDATEIITLPNPPGTCDYGTQPPAVNKPCPIGGGQFGPKMAYGLWVDPTLKTVLNYQVGPNTASSFNGQFILSSVPEPASFALMGAGLIVLAAFGRKFVK